MYFKSFLGNRFREAMSVMGKLALATVCILATGLALAGTIDSATITRLMGDENYGDKLFIDVSMSHSDPIECQTNKSWEFVLDMSTPQGEHYYSMLLTAYASKQPVLLGGAGVCSLHGDIEDLRRIELK
jgi:hypothetical protein